MEKYLHPETAAKIDAHRRTDHPWDQFLRARLRFIAHELQIGSPLDDICNAVGIPKLQAQMLIQQFDLPMPTLAELLEKPETGYLKVRFYANWEEVSKRDVPPLPSWCTGGGLKDAVIVAYVTDGDYLYKHWPDASQVQVFERGVEIEYSDRFPKSQ
jgi:hypothetical protein